MTDDSNVDYRIAVRDDETDILALLEEVAPEIPVSLDGPQRQQAIQEIIIRCRESGKSWVALDADGKVVGFALVYPDVHEPPAISLRYIGVSKDSRQRGIFGVFMGKLKANGAPLTATVLNDNQSGMADRLAKIGFTETETLSNQAKFRWDPTTN